MSSPKLHNPVSTDGRKEKALDGTRIKAYTAFWCSKTISKPRPKPSVILDLTLHTTAKTQPTLIKEKDSQERPSSLSFLHNRPL